MSGDEVCVPAGLTTDGLLGVRYMARFIDSVLPTLLIFAVLRPEGALREPITGSSSFLRSLFNLCLLFILWIGYGSALESSPWQATLGKRLVGLRVYNSQAGGPMLLQATGRNLVKD